MKSKNDIKIQKGQVVLFPLHVSWGVVLGKGVVIEVEGSSIVVNDLEYGFVRVFPSNVWVLHE